MKKSTTKTLTELADPVQVAIATGLAPEPARICVEHDAALEAVEIARWIAIGPERVDGIDGCVWAEREQSINQSIN